MQDVRCRRTCHERQMLSSGNTHCHIRHGTCVGISSRSDQLSRHAEIAKFNNSFTGQENVRRLYIPVDDFSSVQIRQSL